MSIFKKLAEQNAAKNKLTGQDGAGVTKPRGTNQQRLIDFFNPKTSVPNNNPND